VRHPFRRKNLSPRLVPFYALAVAGIWLARPSALGLVFGGAAIAAGCALRLWAAGHLVKTEELTLSGPYAHLRHPLYAGTLLVALGFAAMAGPLALALALAVFVPMFFAYYLPYKERVESQRLLDRYGALFAAYREGVPKLWPRVSAWCPPGDSSALAQRRWSAARADANDEYGVLVGALAGVLLLALRFAR
jgi:protein-S-isoprenylcysteine O-methyltransferase Ste14